MIRALLVLVMLLASAPAALAQQKHALLVVGQAILTSTEVGIAAGMLRAQGYTVHLVRPADSGPVYAAITTLGQTSQDPSVGGFKTFVFYFVGHGGQGMMSLNDNQDKEIGSLLTDNIAQAIFTEIWADSYTFVFDMCDAFSARAHIWAGEAASGKDPEGWILAASAQGPSDTYDIEYTEALALCAGGGPVTNPAALQACLRRERFEKPWWYRSIVMMSEIEIGHRNFPVF